VLLHYLFILSIQIESLVIAKYYIESIIKIDSQLNSINMLITSVIRIRKTLENFKSDWFSATV